MDIYRIGVSHDHRKFSFFWGESAGASRMHLLPAVEYHWAMAKDEPVDQSVVGEDWSDSDEFELHRIQERRDLYEKHKLHISQQISNIESTVDCNITPVPEIPVKWDEVIDPNILNILFNRKSRYEKQRRQKARLSAKTEKRPVGDISASADSDRVWALLPQLFELRDWQVKALEKWKSCGQRGTVKVATGAGKTLFALAAVNQVQKDHPDLFVVIVVPTIPLMYQWQDELHRGSAVPNEIGLMGGGHTPDVGNRILIAVLASAREKLKEFVGNWNCEGRLFLVVDECHRTSADQSRKALDINPTWALGLSATPEPNVGDSSLIAPDVEYNNGPVAKVLGEIIYDYSLAQARKDELLTPFEVWHVGVPLTEDEAIRHDTLSRQISELRRELQIRHRKSNSRHDLIAWCQAEASRGGDLADDCARFIGLANDRKRMLYQSKYRVDAAVEILKEAANRDGTQSILFHEVIEEVDKIFSILDFEDLRVVREHSKRPQRLRDASIYFFRKSIARIIVSAKSLVEGFNVPSADVGVIAASSGSVRQRIQSLGRMLRRKESGRAARIWVLYVRDTEDQAIYQHADWEAIIGAEANKYWYWNPDQSLTTFEEQLVERDSPPRVYRPPCSEADVTSLNLGDPYRYQVRGEDVKLDHSGNLRDTNGALVRLTNAGLRKLRERRPDGRAVVNACGHVIVRDTQREDGEDNWFFLGERLTAKDEPSGPKQTIRILENSGLKEFDCGSKRHSRWAEHDDVYHALIKWIDSEAQRLGEIYRLYWDGKNVPYWIEHGNERITCDTVSDCLTFPPPA